MASAGDVAGVSWCAAAAASTAVTSASAATAAFLVRINRWGDSGRPAAGLWGVLCCGLVLPLSDADANIAPVRW